MKRSQILVGIIMGSQSDWPVMKHASETLTKLAIKHEKKVVSAHRTPDLLFEYAERAHGRGIDCLLYTSPSPRDATLSRMPSSA